MTFFLVSFDRTKSLKQNVRAASASFQRKYGGVPNTFYIHPSHARRDYHVGNLHLIRKPTIMVNTIGVTKSHTEQAQ